jgi:hypothetical protein
MAFSQDWTTHCTKSPFDWSGGRRGRGDWRYDDIEASHFREYREDMSTIPCVYWQDGDMWLGYLQEYPDYMTQGTTLEELQENLRDILADLTDGAVCG